MNDFLLLAQPPKSIGNIFSFEKYANTTFKLYKKVRLKLQAFAYEIITFRVVESAYSYINYCNPRKNINTFIYSMTLWCSEHVYFFAEFEIFVQSVCNAMCSTHLTQCCHQPEVRDVLPHKEMEVYYLIC